MAEVCIPMAAPLGSRASVISSIIEDYMYTSGPSSRLSIIAEASPRSTLQRIHTGTPASRSEVHLRVDDLWAEPENGPVRRGSDLPQSPTTVTTSSRRSIQRNSKPANLKLSSSNGSTAGSAVSGLAADFKNRPLPPIPPPKSHLRLTMGNALTRAVGNADGEEGRSDSSESTVAGNGVRLGDRLKSIPKLTPHSPSTSTSTALRKGSSVSYATSPKTSQLADLSTPKPLIQKDSTVHPKISAYSSVYEDAYSGPHRDRAESVPVIGSDNHRPARFFSIDGGITLPPPPPVPTESRSKYDITRTSGETELVPKPLEVKRSHGAHQQKLPDHARSKSGSALALFNKSRASFHSVLRRKSETVHPASTCANTSGQTAQEPGTTGSTSNDSPTGNSKLTPRPAATYPPPNRRRTIDYCGTAISSFDPVDETNDTIQDTPSPTVELDQALNCLRPTSTNAPPLTSLHTSCFQAHAHFHRSRNAHAPVACMLCYSETTPPRRADTFAPHPKHTPARHRRRSKSAGYSDLVKADRWTCAWCALRICGGCRAELERLPTRCVRTFVERRQARIIRRRAARSKG